MLNVCVSKLKDQRDIKKKYQDASSCLQSGEDN